jgi:hypothetical protein
MSRKVSCAYRHRAMRRSRISKIMALALLAGSVVVGPSPAFAQKKGEDCKAAFMNRCMADCNRRAGRQCDWFCGRRSSYAC